jgi:ditrans,polycis-polyprenyl diphosphate synthase
MSWIRETGTSRLHQWCAQLLRNGPIPQHVAIIMDGNRRYAEKNSYAREQGHLHGFDKLSEVCFVRLHNKFMKFECN